MISIYIVDDEPMAIRYLEMLLEASGFPCEIVGTQTNSTRAYYEIRSMHPDVVFTDISMPVMDGLELAEKILKTGDSRVYLLTSYEDFEYAKKGVKIGVSDYLLKNELTEKMLAGILEEAQQELFDQRKQRQMILERNIRDFLLGSSGGGEDHIYEERALQRYALLTFYRPMRFMIEPDPAAEENLSLDTYELGHMDFPKGMRCAAFAQMRNREYCAVVFISESVVDSRRRLFQMADVILSKITQSSSDWKCICSNICLHFFELQEQYRELERRTGYLYAKREQSIFGMDDVAVPDRRDAGYEEFVEEIYRLLTDGKHSQAAETSEKYFELCRTYDTQTLYMEHMRSYYQALRRCTLRDGKGLEHLAIPRSYTSYADLERALLNCMELYFEERERTAGLQYSEYVLRAQQFIRREYIRDISVADIALAAGISEGHLRRLFKQEMNMSVVDYLTEYRITQAKHLLREHIRSASEVWKETGFSSAQYFSYVFKKKEGISPRDYQRRGGTGEAGAGIRER